MKAKKKTKLLPIDRKAIRIARVCGIYVLCGRGDKSEPLYRFYDKTTGVMLAYCNQDWGEGLRRACRRKGKMREGDWS